MGNLKIKELFLLENEEILYHVEGNAYSGAHNPLVKLYMMVVEIIVMIFGVKLTTYIIATNMRIIRVDRRTGFWGLVPTSIDIITMNKHSIGTVGYSYVTRWFLFKTAYFTINEINIKYKGSNSELAKIVSEFSRLIVM